MKKVRKIILGLGAVGVVATTGSVILSCGSNGTRFVPWSGMDGGATTPIEPSKDMKPFFDKITTNEISNALSNNLGKENLLKLVIKDDWSCNFENQDIKNVTIKVINYQLVKYYDKTNLNKAQAKFTIRLIWGESNFARTLPAYFEGYLYDQDTVVTDEAAIDGGASMPVKPSKDMKPFFDNIGWEEVGNVLSNNLGKENLLKLVIKDDWSCNFENQDIKNVTIKVIDYQLVKYYDKTNLNKARAKFTVKLTWGKGNLEKTLPTYFDGYLYDQDTVVTDEATIDGGASMPIKPSKDMKPFFDKITTEEIGNVLSNNLGKENLLKLVIKDDWSCNFENQDIKNVTIKVINYQLVKYYDKARLNKAQAKFTVKLTWGKGNLERTLPTSFYGYLYDQDTIVTDETTIDGGASMPIKPSKDMKPIFDKITTEEIGNVLSSNLGNENLLKLVIKDDWSCTFENKDIKNVTIKVINYHLAKYYDKTNLNKAQAWFDVGLKWNEGNLERTLPTCFYGYLYDQDTVVTDETDMSGGAKDLKPFFNQISPKEVGDVLSNNLGKENLLKLVIKQDWSCTFENKDIKDVTIEPITYELVKYYDKTNLNKAQARFNTVKLKWCNFERTLTSTFDGYLYNQDTIVTDPDTPSGKPADRFQAITKERIDEFLNQPDHIGCDDLSEKGIDLSKLTWPTDDFGLKNVIVRITDYLLIPNPDRPDLCHVYLTVKLEYTNLEGKYNELSLKTVVEGFR